MPAGSGIYAEVHWSTRGVRIGETGQSLRAKFAHDAAWMQQMHDGTAPHSQLRRLQMTKPHPIVFYSASEGPSAFEFFVVSADPQLSDQFRRHGAERFLFAWLRQQHNYQDWNRQVSWRLSSDPSRGARKL